MTEREDASDQEEQSNLRGFDDYSLLLGDIMRGERATMGKSLLDVQRELKIKAAYISAIEETDPSVFDTPGFIAGYVRSYARYLGLDPEWAFKTFCDEGNYTVSHGMSAAAAIRQQPPTIKGTKGDGTGSETAKQVHVPRDPFTQPSVSYLPKSEAAFSGIEPRAVGSVAVLLVLLCGIGYGGWSVLQEVQKVRFTPVEQTPEVLVELDPLAPARSAVEAEGTETAELVAPTTDQFARIYRPEALDVPKLIARDGPISAIDPDTIGTLAPERGERLIASRDPRPDTAPFATPGSASSGPDMVTLDAVVADLGAEGPDQPVQVSEPSAPSVALLAVRPSWVRVRAADGTVIFEKILDAGEQFEVPLTEAPATLRAGNAGSLYFAVNGQTYGPAGDGPVVVKDVTLAPDALRGAYSVADVQRDTDLARFIAVAEAQSGGNAATE